MKTILLGLLTLVSFTNFMNKAEAANTYCLGEFYNMSYSFRKHYAVRCGKEEKLKYYSGKSKAEIISDLRAQGINFARTAGSKKRLTDIYVVGEVEKEEASRLQIVKRVVFEKGWKTKAQEFIVVYANDHVINYDPTKGYINDYRRLNTILKTLNLEKLGVVDDIDPRSHNHSKATTEMIIVKKLK